MIPASQKSQHIDQLLTDYKIDVKWRDWWWDELGLAALNDRQVIIRPIRSFKTYVIALHEIGHLVGANKYDSCLEQEAQAWMWAARNSIIWSLRKHTYMQEMLMSHKAFAMNDKRFKIPGDGSAFDYMMYGKYIGDLDNYQYTYYGTTT